jgi:hypothetical protein
MQFHEAVSADCARRKNSLQYHKELNPRLWDAGRLRPEVTKAMMRVISAWVEHAKIPPDSIIDYYFTGANANYNYTPSSDCDVHVIVDQEKLKSALGIMRDETLEWYLRNEKTIWTLHHPDVRVRGYPVEPYAQMSDEPVPEGQGAWSLMRGAWVTEPSMLESDPTCNLAIERKADQMEHEIDKMVDGRADDEAIALFKERLFAMRSVGLRTGGGEFSLQNLVFKELRNRGALEKLKNNNLDKELSLR